MNSVENKTASSLVVSLSKALNGIVSTFEWLDISHLVSCQVKLPSGSNRWQLDSKTEKVTSLSLGYGTLANKWASAKLQFLSSYQVPTFFIRIKNINV